MKGVINDKKWMTDWISQRFILLIFVWYFTETGTSLMFYLHFARRNHRGEGDSWNKLNSLCPLWDDALTTVHNDANACENINDSLQRRNRRSNKSLFLVGKTMRRRVGNGADNGHTIVRRQQAFEGHRFVLSEKCSPSDYGWSAFSIFGNGLRWAAWTVGIYVQRPNAFPPSENLPCGGCFRRLRRINLLTGL